MASIIAAVIPERNAPVALGELPEPELERDSALLDIALSEVCGTDLYLQQGKLAGVPYPLIPGHVSVGWLSKIRGRLFDLEGNPFAEGDPVTFLDVHGTCNACWFCLVAKATTCCPNRRVYGITYGLADGLSGGWAQKLYLKPKTKCIRLADEHFEKYMAGGCALPTALHAVERADIGIGDTVLVLGSGPVGLSTVVLALMRGALHVLYMGAPEHRLESARRVGACATLNIENHIDDERRQWILDLTGGRGADVTIEATGAPEAVLQAMQYTRDAGRVVIVGQYTDHGAVSFNPHTDLNRKHLDIRGCWGSAFSHFYRGVQIMSDFTRSAPWGLLPLDRYGLAQVNEALAEVAAGRVVEAPIDPKLS